MAKGDSSGGAGAMTKPPQGQGNIGGGGNMNSPFGPMQGPGNVFQNMKSNLQQHNQDFLRGPMKPGPGVSMFGWPQDKVMDGPWDNNSMPGGGGQKPPWFDPSTMGKNFPGGGNQGGDVTRQGSQMMRNGQVVGHYGNNNQEVWNQGQGPSGGGGLPGGTDNYPWWEQYPQMPGGPPVQYAMSPGGNQNNIAQLLAQMGMGQTMNGQGPMAGQGQPRFGFNQPGQMGMGQGARSQLSAGGMGMMNNRNPLTGLVNPPGTDQYGNPGVGFNGQPRYA